MPSPLLPALIDGKGPSNLATPGKWLPNNHDELLNVSKILDVNIPNAEINSIPTVWARPLLFQMALFDEDHKMHSQILGEWRGLLTLIALYEFKNLPLTAIPINLSILNDSKNERLFKSLSKLIPRESIADDTSWEDLFIFLYENKPIGITSPTTLVATSTDCSYRGINVKWYDTTRLKNPIDKKNSINNLTPQEMKSLASWLDNLLTKLNSHDKKVREGKSVKVDDKLLGSIKKLLNRFIEDLSDKKQNFIPGKDNLGILGEKAGVFSYLDKPVGEPVEEQQSAVELIPNQTPKPSVKLLLVDKRIADEWNVSPSQVTVYRTRTLNDLGIEGHPDGRHNKFAGIDISGAEVWKPSELFSEKLLLIRKDNAFPEAINPHWIGSLPTHNSARVSMVLPINKKLLEYLTPEELNERLTFEQTNNNEIKARLRLNLSGLDGSPKEFTAVKIFSLYKTEDFEIIDDLPILEVFPKFRRAGWKANYIAYSADNPNATFEVEPLNSAGEEADINIANSKIKRKIWRTNSFPEVLVCKRNNQEVGVLLLKPEETTNQNKVFQVGIDFGASGTCVYKSNDNNPQCVEFFNQKLMVTKKDVDQQSEIFDFFLPDVTLKTPFLSLFQPFNNQQNNNVVKPMIEGHIYYFQDKLAKDIVPDLKWSENPTHRLYVKSFLIQLCLQTAASLASEGASSIEWKFSYPTAFFGELADEYKDVIWNEAVKECHQLTGLGNPVIEHFTESLASARYFRKAEGAHTDSGAVFIDIGSSTSDISVWQEDNPLWQTSLKYAGRDVFLNYLISKPDVLVKLLGDEKTKDLHEAKSANQGNEKIWAAVDVILRKHTQEIFNNALGIHSPTREIKALKQYLAFGLGGLFYYLGLGVKNLIESKKYKSRMPSIYAGGNGALMFRWLTNGGNLDGNSTITNFFKTIFSKGLDTEVNGNFSLKLSQNPKHEASHGLVRIDDDRLLIPSEDVVAGENFSLDGENKNWNTPLNAEIFQQELTIPDRLENLENYIKVFNEAAAQTSSISEIRFTKDELYEIRNTLENSLGELRRSRQNSQKIVVEPIFIMALKDTMKFLARRTNA